MLRAVGLSIVLSFSVVPGPLCLFGGPASGGYGYGHGHGYGYGYGYGGGHGSPSGRCRPVSFPGLVVSPTNSSYRNGETVEISCKEGYVLNARRNTSTCRVFTDFFRRGTFMPAITSRTCTELPGCRVPLTPGIMITPQKRRYEIGDKITVSCKEGFEQTGDEDYTCEKKSDYFGFEYGIFGIRASELCREIIDCHAPEQNGLRVEPPKRMYKPGEEISLSCEDGYDLTVANVSVCDKSGQFNFQQAKTSHPDYNRYTQHHFIFTSSVCIKKTKCLAPEYDGLIVTPIKESYVSGEEITLSCDEDYELRGLNKSTCGYKGDSAYHYDVFGFMDSLSGRGQFKPTVHRRTCTPIPRCYKPQGPGVIVTPERESYKKGETVEISCKAGYEMDDNITSSTCEIHTGLRTRRFSPNLRSACKRIPSCDRPTANGLVLSPDKEYYEIGDKVSLSCEEGYEQRVPPTSTCMRALFGKVGEFDPALSMEPCRKPTSCKAPRDENLIVSPAKESYSEGEEITLSCKEGYTRRAAENMTCERARHCRGEFERVNGCFHPSAPRVACLKTPKCELPVQDHLIVTPEKESYELGDAISLSCEEGYELIGSFYKNLKCRSAGRLFSFRIELLFVGFKPNLPRKVCKERPTCDAPDAQPGLILTPQKDKYYLGETIQLSCAEGYELTGDNSAQCVVRITSMRWMIQKKMAYKPKIADPACKKIEIDEKKEEEAEKDSDTDEEETSGEEEIVAVTQTTEEPTPPATETSEIPEQTPLPSESQGNSTARSTYPERPVLSRDTKIDEP